jgi:hypothetical protein
MASFLDKFFNPQTQDMTKKVLRQVLPMAGGFLIGKGYVSTEAWSMILTHWEAIFGQAVALGSLIWMARSNTPKAKAETVANMKGYVVGAPDAVAKASTNVDVVPASKMMVMP